MRLMIVVVVFLFLNDLWARSNLVFIDNSVTNDTYIPSNKKKQVESAFRLASKDLKKKFPKCDLIPEEAIGRSNPLFMFEQSKAIKNNKGNTFLVGMIHSSEALLGAKAFLGSNILGLSSGAATNNLAIENANFFSLANSVDRMSEHIKRYFEAKKIQKILAVVPGNSSYSIELAKSLKAKVLKTNLVFKLVLVDTSNEESLKSALQEVNSFELIYVPGFLQQTLPVFQFISKLEYKGIIYGSANLARSKQDLLLFSKALKLSNSKVMLPATWISGETLNSKELENRFKKDFKEEIMGTAVYTYDAAVIAGSYLCLSNEITRGSFEEFVRNVVIPGKLELIRKYLNFENGHFASGITTVKFDLSSQKFVREFSDD